MSYSVLLKKHLARYKRSVLRLEEDGTWSRNGRSYPHILPAAQQDLNLVEPIRNQCLTYMAAEGIKRHRDFAHLNSSQAFAFNLFFPWLTDRPDGDRSLLDALGMPGRIERWAFEAVLDQEEGTNFDLWLELEGDRQVFVEVKLTEAGFGTAKPDARHKAKLDDIYRERLVGKVRPAALDQDVFFSRYQLLRNVSYVDPGRGHILCLLFPKANDSARREAETFVEDLVLADCRSLVRIVYAEDLASRLRRGGGGGEAARASLRMVEQKYSLDTVELVGV